MLLQLVSNGNQLQPETSLGLDYHADEIDCTELENDDQDELDVEEEEFY